MIELSEPEPPPNKPNAGSKSPSPKVTNCVLSEPISKIVSTYTAGVTIGDDEMKKAARDEFSSKYGAEALAADVAVGRAIDRIAHRHVVGRDGLGDRARGPAHAEKPAHHLLPRPDLGKRAIAPGVQVDLQSFLIGIEFFVGHNLGALFA